MDISLLTARIGAEIRIDRKTLIEGSKGREIRALLEDRGVISIRGLFLTDDEQIQVAKSIGNIVAQKDGRIVTKISVDKNVNPNPIHAEYQKSAFLWHLDGATDGVPNLGAVMTPHALSTVGGDTEFANTYAAYEDLPDPEKEELDALKVVHSLESSQRAVNGWPTYEQLQRWQQSPPRTNPLVWKHRSGRKSLVLGTTASHVLGMSLEAGRALLCRLCEWATQPRYVYTHKWNVGDTVIWDNTGTLHRATPYPDNSGRVMHRTTLSGEEPIA